MNENINDLKLKIEELKSNGKSIVLAQGGFDIFHAGHLRYLKAAKEMGDCLVVAVSSDECARDEYGDGYPVVALKERIPVVAAMEPVDFVVINEKGALENIIKELKPDCFALPQERSDSSESYGCKVVAVGEYEAGYSTKAIIDKIKKASHKQK